MRVNGTDYGVGFYTTTDKAYVKQFAKPTDIDVGMLNLEAKVGDCFDFQNIYVADPTEVEDQRVIQVCQLKESEYGLVNEI